MKPVTKSMRRRQLLANKLFLLNIWREEDPGKLTRTLQEAKDSELEVLLLVLHYVAKGDIPLSKAKYNERVLKTPMDRKLGSIRQRSGMLKVKTSGRQELLKFLKDFKPGFSTFLYFLFHRQSAQELPE